MAQLIVPNGVQVKVRWNLPGAVSSINVLGATAAGAPVVNQALANALDTAIKSGLTTSGLAALLGTGVSLASVGVRSVHLANQAEYIGAGAAQPGTGVGDVMPRGAALVVTLRTGLAGKSYRGRVYLAGFIEAENDANGAVVTAANTAAAAFVTAIQSALTAQSLTLAVLSPALPQRTTRSGDTLAAKIAFATTVTSITTRNTTWASQRRRNHRR